MGRWETTMTTPIDPDTILSRLDAGTLKIPLLTRLAMWEAGLIDDSQTISSFDPVIPTWMTRSEEAAR